MKKASRSTVRSRKPASRSPESDEIRPEYDFSQGVRGKYAARFAEGTNLVLLEPDVAAEFRDAKAVNRVLRAYLKKQRTVSRPAWGIHCHHVAVGVQPLQTNRA